MSKIHFISAEEEDALARKRVRIDEKLLRRVQKKFASYSNAQHSTDTEQLRLNVELEYVNLSITLKKSAQLQDLFEVQNQIFKQQTAELIQEQKQIREDIASLKSELKASRELEAQKSGYDKIAQEILTYADRDEANEMINKAQQEIEALKQARIYQLDIWKERSLEFESVSSKLHDLANTVSQEKESGRRAALLAAASGDASAEAEEDSKSADDPEGDELDVSLNAPQTNSGHVIDEREEGEAD